MDKFWSILAMPMGVLICFAPALAAWLKLELAGEKTEKKKQKK